MYGLQYCFIKFKAGKKATSSCVSPINNLLDLQFSLTQVKEITSNRDKMHLLNKLSRLHLSYIDQHSLIGFSSA